MSKDKGSSSSSATLKYAEQMHTVLRDKFGFTSFQGRQEEAIGAALAGRDTFVLMPTGGGKSLCYCLPALVKKGVVVVISPLIALMENQVENLRKKDICCDFLSSTRSAEDRRAILDNIQSQSPQMRLLYATPELLTTDGFMLVLKNMYKRGNLTLFAVDESHCISSWGHDFRPAYRKLSVVRRELPQVPIMALTATAAEKVQDDIVKQLRLRNPALLVSSFNRPNIHYCVHYLFEAGALDPLPHVVALLKEGRSQDAASRWPCAVIYTLKRETAGEVAFSLSAKGIPAAAYHAGLKTAERTCVLSDWASGKTPVVAATVAFGMGIDKADVRLVVHYNLPKTIEGFYQESGRAGRDGRPAKSVLFYSRDDRDRMDFILGKPKKGKRKRKQPKSQQGNGELQAFGQLVGYCTARCCRRAILLRHFGEVLPAGTCTGCDYCEDPHGVAEQLERLESEVVIGAARRGGRRRSFGKADLPAYAGGADLASSAEDGKDSSDAASGEDEDDSEEAQAAKQALKRARTGDASDEAVLSVMAAAERRYANTSQQTGCTSNSLLNKLRLPNTKAAPAKPGSAVVGESMRAAARERIQKALEANGALSNLSQQQLAAASQACEEQCFNTSGSKPVYLSKLSNTAREAAKVAAVMDITCLAGCADPTDLGTTDATQDASLPEEVHADKAAAGPSQGAAGRMGSTPSRMMGKPIPTCARLAADMARVPEQSDACQQSSGAGSAGPPSAVASHQALLMARFRSIQEAISQLPGRLAEGTARGLGPDVVPGVASDGDAQNGQHTHGSSGVTASASGSPEQAAIQGLHWLQTQPVTQQLLAETGLGKDLRKLTKHACQGVAEAAAAVIAAWKQMLLRS